MSFVPITCIHKEENLQKSGSLQDNSFTGKKKKKDEHRRFFFFLVSTAFCVNSVLLEILI